MPAQPYFLFRVLLLLTIYYPTTGLAPSPTLLKPLLQSFPVHTTAFDRAKVHLHLDVPPTPLIMPDLPSLRALFHREYFFSFVFICSHVSITHVFFSYLSLFFVIVALYSICAMRRLTLYWLLWKIWKLFKPSKCWINATEQQEVSVWISWLWFFSCLQNTLTVNVLL